ncbi:AAA family ATPase [Nocardioides islandensis]|uniref:AAA family ATPase n=2 Tax=Nocardioides islandensis TaxID=433663 RepID=A0A930YL83_9ACTN|nr:AAA family ATPase [Nocardioides islandensis]
MHGGLKIYRGAAAAARNYVEADRSRADDYYLAEGSGHAELFVARRTELGAAVRHVASLDGDAYESWVAGYVIGSGEAKGRLRTDDQGVRFVEVALNGPKTWSLVAALHPEIAAACDAAQQRAAEEIIAWIAEHATTRVGPRGLQVQVPVDEIEAVVVRHYTSRAGDPHRHLHLQINSRVLVGERWRGLHTVGVRDSLGAINGIGHGAVMCDPEFRSSLAAHGYTLDLESGEVVELAPYVGRFSARTTQIRTNVDRYEAEWRMDHPGQEPGSKLRMGWDRRAWAEARPDKVVPRDGVELGRRWVEELRDVGFQPVNPRVSPASVPIGSVDRDAIVATVLSRLGSRRSAWNGPDLRGEVEQQLTMAGIVASPLVRRELAEDLAARAVQASVPLLPTDNTPEHVRALTSQRVLEVEERLTTRLTTRSLQEALPGRTPDGERFDTAQLAALTAIDGTAQLLVIEGAAGAGKTQMLASARFLAETRGGRRLVVVSPTLKASQVAANELGTPASSAARLIHQHGYRWDDEGRWTREPAWPVPAAARLRHGDILLVDEAGMLDQDTALALVTIADEAHARLVLVGDRHQLPAVGRGGVLDLASVIAPSRTKFTLDVVHRFEDPEYAELSLLMRRGERPGDVFDRLVARGEIRIHPTEVERLYALAEEPGFVIADTREQVTALNAAIRSRRLERGELSRELPETTTLAGERLTVGDRVSTRRNEPDLGVANRETWTVSQVLDGGAIEVVEGNRTRQLPGHYVERSVELAYATTAYGAQGQTVDTSNVVVSEHSGAAATYVGMSRGRQRNVAHLVADSVADAREQWTSAFARDRADLGPAHARLRAFDDVERYGIAQPGISRHPRVPSPDRDGLSAPAR